MNSICVFCGSHVGGDPAYLEAARKLGRELAEQKIRLVYGGADVGLMGMVANSCLESGGEVIGVMPKKLVDMEVSHNSLSEMHIVDSMHERKALMAELSDAFIALPGGIGTLEELFEMFTWVQLGIHAKLLGLLNIKGYYDQLIGFLKTVVGEGFMQARHLEMLMCETDEKLLVDHLKSGKPEIIDKWGNKLANKIASNTGT